MKPTTVIFSAVGISLCDKFSGLNRPTHVLVRLVGNSHCVKTFGLIMQIVGKCVKLFFFITADFLNNKDIS